MSKSQWLKAFLHAGFNLFRRPEDIHALLGVGDLIAETNWFSKCAKRLEKQDYDGLMKTPQSALPSLEQLKDYPSESLGFHYYQFMKAHQLSVYPICEKIPDEKIWLRERSRNIHDLLHVVLNLGIEVQSEIKLNAHLMYSINLPISRLIVLGGMLRLFFTNPRQFFTTRKELVQIKAWSQSHPCLLLQSFENWLQLPLNEVRGRIQV